MNPAVSPAAERRARETRPGRHQRPPDTNPRHPSGSHALSAVNCAPCDTDRRGRRPLFPTDLAEAMAASRGLISRVPEARGDRAWGSGGGHLEAPQHKAARPREPLARTAQLRPVQGCWSAGSISPPRRARQQRSNHAGGAVVLAEVLKRRGAHRDRHGDLLARANILVDSLGREGEVMQCHPAVGHQEGEGPGWDIGEAGRVEEEVPGGDPIRRTRCGPPSVVGCIGGEVCRAVTVAWRRGRLRRPGRARRSGKADSGRATSAAPASRCEEPDSCQEREESQPHLADLYLNLVVDAGSKGRGCCRRAGR